MKIMRYVICYLMFLFPIATFADENEGFGYIAQSLIEPVSVISEFVASASIIIGISFLFGGFLRYLQYRINPMASPISTVVMLLIMGVVLVCLPLAYKLTGAGIPYTYSLKI